MNKQTNKWGRRNNSCVEFQIICVDYSPLKEVELTPHSLCMGCTQWLPSKGTVWSGANNLTLECRNLLISARQSRSTSTVISPILWTYDMRRMLYTSMVFLTKTYNPSLTMRKTWQSPIKRCSIKKPDQSYYK